MSSDAEGRGRYDRDRYQRDRDSDRDDLYREVTDYETESSEEDNEDPPDVDVSKLQLCPDHKPGSMTRECDSCAAALVLIPHSSVINKLLSATDAGNHSRYAGRCDEVEATLDLSPMTIDLMKETFNEGKFRDKKIWSDIVKSHLTLKTQDHVKLTEDITTEDVFNKYRREPRFKPVFKFVSAIKDAIKDVRLAQRPLFSIIQSLSDELNLLRKLGEDVGIDFHKVPPSRKGNNVPRGGRKVPNYLDYESSANVFPRPDLTEWLTQNDVNAEGAQDLEAILDKYRNEVVQEFMDLFKSFSTVLTKYDDNLIFYRVRNYY